MTLLLLAIADCCRRNPLTTKLPHLPTTSRRTLSLPLACPGSSDDKYRGIRWRLPPILGAPRSHVTLFVIEPPTGEVFKVVG